MSGEILLYLLRFLNEYGESKNAKTRIQAEASLESTDEALGTGGSCKETLSSMVIFGFFCFFFGGDGGMKIAISQ